MPPIDNLPRPWLLAAMTGVPISVLVGTERSEREDQPCENGQARTRAERRDQSSEVPAKPSMH